MVEGCDLIRQKKAVAAELARWSDRLVREERLAMYLQHTGLTCRRRLAQIEREQRNLLPDHGGVEDRSAPLLRHDSRDAES